MNTANQRTVLVFPGGTEIGLEVARSLKPCKEVRLVSVGLAGTPAELFFPKHYNVPTVRDEGWLEALRGVVKREGVTEISHSNKVK